MSLKQIVDEIKQLSADELEELGFELDKARLMRLSHEMAARWAGKTFDVRVFTDASGLPDLFAEDFRIKSKAVSNFLDSRSLDLW